MNKLPFPIKPIVFAILSVLLVYLCIPDNILKTAYADNAGSGSTIAGISVAGLDGEEMKAVLEEGIQAWITEPITVYGAEQEVLIDATGFTFDVDASVEQFKETVDQPWYAFWASEQTVHLPLQVTVSEEVTATIADFSSWDTEATLNSITTQASYLKEREIEAVLAEFTQIDNERIALSIEEIPTEASGVQEIVEVLNNTILYPGEPFSFIERAGEISANYEGRNFVASLLYDVVLHTEFEIIERHAQEKVPTYLQAGINAAINLPYKEDLQFLNSSTSAVKLNATVEGSTLKVELYANEKNKEVLVQISHEEIEPRIINRYSEDVAIGEAKLLQEGAKGERVIVTRVISESGNTTEEQISRDYYAPTNRILLISARQQSVTNPNSSLGTTDPNVNLAETVNPNGTTTPDGTQNHNQSNDPDTQIDLDNNGLPDVQSVPGSEEEDEEELPEGSYYDKGGNLITP